MTVTPNSRCTCGHIKMHHGFGLECGIVGCECLVFGEYVVEPKEPRVRVPKTLDRDDPKLFPVAL